LTKGLTFSFWANYFLAGTAEQGTVHKFAFRDGQVQRPRVHQPDVPHRGVVVRGGAADAEDTERDSPGGRQHPRRC